MPVGEPSNLAQKNAAVKKARERVEQQRQETEEERSINSKARCAPNLLYSMLRQAEKQMDKKRLLSRKPKNKIGLKRLGKLLSTDDESNQAEVDFSTAEFDQIASRMSDQAKKEELAAVYDMHLTLKQKVMGGGTLTRTELHDLMIDRNIYDLYLTYCQGEIEDPHKY